jgi:1-acyl-sn-glycerol-3-phosphate acyltransferase
MRKYLVWPYQIYSWLIFVPYLGISTLFFGLLTIILVRTTNPRFASMFVGKLWTRLIAYMTPIFVKVEGRENIVPGQSYVIVSNHQSLYDIAVMYGWLDIDIRWVMKKELRKVPGLGPACAKIGHIFIDRTSFKKSLKAIYAAKDVLTDGTSVVFFPEGTRTETGELGEFKRGAFKIAYDFKLPILPITIVGTREILPSKSVLIAPGRVKMVIHPPVPMEGKKKTSIDVVQEEVRETIKSALDA